MAEDLFERYQKPIPVGFNLYLEGEDEYYQIENRETFNIEKDYSSLDPNATLGKTEETVIEPSDDVIYQLWVGIEHDIKLFFWQPSSTKSLGTDEDPDGFMTMDISPKNSPNRDYTFFIPPERTIHLDMENLASVTITPNLRFTGFKYQVTKLNKKPSTFLTLPTESFGG